MQKPVAPKVVSEINVTPMVDVMLVLLIIFIVITPLLTKGVTVEFVKAKNPIADAERRQGRRDSHIGLAQRAGPS